MWKFIDDKMTGTIFNIQRYSINDGPGIRTTVFLKGCPLSCRWCHNPESISPQKEVVIHEERCIRCGSCVEVCENNAAQQINDQIITIRENCIQCGKCIDVCYTEARAIAGKDMSTEEVLDEIERDTVFYNESGGGVTFSGGEPFLQHEFLLSLLRSCQQKNIYTAVDTSGFVASDILKKASDWIDLFLYDIKTIDEHKHREFTGVSNKLILENLKMLAAMNKNIIVRIPVIPGINDNIPDVKHIGEYVGTLGNISEINLLPFHKSGIEKYKRVGRKFTMPEMELPNSELMEMMTNELQKYVRTVKIGG